MKMSRYRIFAVLFALFGIFALVFLLARLGGTSLAMRNASDLMAVHGAMSKDGVYGFLPGNQSRLNERLRSQSFTSVSIMPTMVTGDHFLNVAGLQFGTSIVILRDSGTNTWTVWRDVSFGKFYWKSKVGHIDNSP